MMVTTVELVVGDDAEVLNRIVRVVCTRPFALTMLHYWQVPGSADRRVLMDVEVDGRGELLSKRLNRITAVVRVRLLDQYEAPSRRKGPDWSSGQAAPADSGLPDKVTGARGR